MASEEANVELLRIFLQQPSSNGVINVSVGSLLLKKVSKKRKVLRN